MRLHSSRLRSAVPAIGHLIDPRNVAARASSTRSATVPDESGQSGSKLMVSGCGIRGTKAGPSASSLRPGSGQARQQTARQKTARQKARRRAGAVGGQARQQTAGGQARPAVDRPGVNQLKRADSPPFRPSPEGMGHPEVKIRKLRLRHPPPGDFEISVSLLYPRTLGMEVLLQPHGTPLDHALVLRRTSGEERC